MVTIDLTELTKGKVRLLSGHPRGLEARSFFGLDELDDSSEEIDIVAPKNLEAITTSFVQGFFGRSYKKFQDENQLFERYKLALAENLVKDFHDGVKRLAITRRLAEGS